MVRTDSESESECFESAEESLEEDGERQERKTRSNKNSKENEVAEPVGIQKEKESKSGLPEDVSVNLSYRKRPERVKRTPTGPLQRINTRSEKRNETVFKSDATDVFFHDITSNLSKNINKSLHTLQLTSSNVKELILNSLPAPAVSEKENFAYDDSLNVLPTSVDKKILSNEVFDDKEVCKNDCLNESQKILPRQCDETNVLDFSRTQGNDVCNSVIKKENLEVNLENDLLLRNSASVSFSEAVSLNSCKSDESIIGFNKLDSETNIMGVQDNKLAVIVDNKGEILKNSQDHVSKFSKLINEKSFEEPENEAGLSQSEMNVSFLTNVNINKPECEKLNNENTKSHFSSEIVSEFVLSKVDNTDTRTSFQTQNYSDNVIGQKFYLDSTNQEAKLNSNYKNISTQNNKSLNEDSKTEFDKKDKTIDKIKETKVSKIDCNPVQGQKSVCDLKNYVSDIKTDNISKGKQNQVKDKDEISEGEAPEIGFKGYDLSNSWEDFDFSDNEVEGTNAENKNKCAALDISTNGEAVKLEKYFLTEAADFVENKTDENFKALEGSDKVSLKKDPKEETVVHKKEEEISENEDFEEGWDWESWDNEADDAEEKEGELVHKTSDKNYDKAENSFDGRSKWSGLDSFSQRIEERQGNWNLGSWGVNLLLDKATAVTQGISNVLEAGLGAPDPETLARMQKEEERQLKQEKIKTDEELEEIPRKNTLTSANLFPVSGITNLVAGVTSKIVEHTKIQEIGSKVLTGGLDTLETFGKKTMEVLQDGDPGLRNKRALLTGNNKPVLSQILREAREKAEKEMKQAEEKALEKKCHFETLFDDYQGMVHLEALEMLSRQYELKITQLKSGMSSEELEELEGVLEEVEQLCVLDDLDMNSVLDFKSALQMAVEPLKEEISIEKIIQISDSANKWLKTAYKSGTSQTLLHQKAVSTIAELTAATVHEFLKGGELLSIKECRKTVDEIEALAKFTNILCMEINKLCEKFILTAENKMKKELDSANTISKKVIIMRNNSTSYIKEAFNLLLPVLQAGAVL